MEIYSVIPQRLDVLASPTFLRTLVGDGAVGAPGLAFTDALTTGLYRSGSGSGEQINFAISGTQRAFIAPSGIGIDDQASTNFGMLTFSGTAMTANRTLTLDLNNTSSTLEIESSSILNQDYSSDSLTVKWPQLTFDFATQDYLITNRAGLNLAIQSQASSTSSQLELYTKDGDGTDSCVLNIFGFGTPADITDRTLLQLGLSGANYVLNVTGAGTQSVPDFRIYTGVNTTQLVLNTDNTIDMSGDLGVTGGVTAATYTLNFATQDWVFSNRAGQALTIQGQESNRTAEVEIYTGDGDGAQDVMLSFFPLGVPSDLTDKEQLRIGFDVSLGGVGEVYVIEVLEAGTGDLHPIHVAADGSADVDQLVLNTDGTVKIDNDLIFSSGSITSDSGTIDFGNENLQTSGFVITQRVQGFNDSDTYFVFAADQVQIHAGGAHMLTCFESIVGDRITINPTLANIDFQVQGDTVSNVLLVDASADQVNLKTTTIGDGGVTNYTGISNTGDITQNGTGRFIESSKFKMTSIGGYAIKLTNKTGGNTVQGQTVKADTATDDGVILTAADDNECFGVFLDAGIADDAEAWVVIAGIADVAMGDDEAATHGNWVETNSAEAGYADATSGSPAAAPQHFNEIGHCIETVAAGGGGTHILARCVLHFN